MLHSELQPLLQNFEEQIDPAERYHALQAWYSEIRQSGDAAAPATPATSADAYRIELFNRRFARVRKTGGFFASLRRSGKKAGGPRTGGADGAGSFSADALPVPEVPGDFDLYLCSILTMLAIYKNGSLFKKHSKKEVLSMLQDIQLDERPLQDKSCEDILYREIRNAFRRYFSTCQNSAYGKKLLGTIDSSREEKEALRCKETWIASYGMARQLGLEEEMAVWCRAANDEYCASVPGAASLEDACAAYGEKDPR